MYILDHVKKKYFILAFIILLASAAFAQTLRIRPAAEHFVFKCKLLKNPVFPDGKQIMQNNQRFIRMAYKAGCILTTGTDQVGFTILPGYSLWREMEIFSEAGMKSMDVLKAATSNGAYALGQSDLLGAVEAGKLADFVVLDANPLRNISNVRKVHMVVKGGVIYEPAKLLKRLEGKYH